LLRNAETTEVSSKPFIHFVLFWVMIIAPVVGRDAFNDTTLSGGVGLQLQRDLAQAARIPTNEATHSITCSAFASTAPLNCAKVALLRC